MIRVSPVLRMSLGLVFISITILMLLNFLGLLPDQSKVTMETRKSTAESLAVRYTYAARDNNAHSIRKTMDSMVELNPDILSMGIRGPLGRYLAQTVDHQVHWDASSGGVSTLTHWEVPISKGSKEWGTLEIRFTPKGGFAVLGYRVSPFSLLLIAFSVISLIVYVLFMKKSFQYLDPSSVMPSRVKYALDSLSEGVLILDKKGRIVLANSVFSEKLGVPEKELMGLKASKLNWIDPDTNSVTEELPWSHSISTGEAQTGILLNFKSKSHGMKSFMLNSSPVLDDKGKTRGAVVTFDDITELEKHSFQLTRMVELLQMSKDKINNKNIEISRKNEELEILATTDSLTGCLNRRAFFEQAEHCMTTAIAKESNLSCIMADLDNFKSINDTYGHVVGDQVIKFFVETVKSQVRNGDLVCRYGGEEFCVLLPDCDMENTVLLIDRVRDILAAQSVEAIPQAPGINVSASFGVSDSILGARSIEELLSQADGPLYEAKAAGRNRVICWDSIKENQYVEQAKKC